MQSRRITLYDIRRTEENPWSHYTNQILCVFEWWGHCARREKICGSRIATSLFIKFGFG